MPSALPQRSCQPCKPLELASGFYGASSASDFFFTVTCACRRPGPYCGILRHTVWIIAPPALMLLRRGYYFLGVTSGSLVLTSVLYHRGHNPLLRAIDLVAVVSTLAFGMLQNAHAIYRHGLNSCLAMSLVGAVLLNAINGMSFSRERASDGSATETMALPWHVSVHLVTAITLALLAVGWEAQAVEVAKVQGVAR